MSEKILSNLLNKNISVDRLFQWLTSNNTEETLLPDITQCQSTRAAFVASFLSYLREQSKCVLPESKELQEKLIKKAEIPSVKILAGRCDKDASTFDGTNRLMPGYDPRSSGQAGPINPIDHGGMAPMYPVYYPPCVPSYPGRPYPLPNHMSSPQFNGPRFIRGPNVSYNSPNVIYNNVMLADNQQPAMPFFPPSPMYNTSPVRPSNANYSNVSTESISPKRSDSQSSNRSYAALCGVLSPLSVNTTSSPSPNRANKSHYETINSPGCTSESRTPKHTPSSSERTFSKSSRNHGICFGDFLVSDGNQSLKKSAKKNVRAQQWRKAQETNSPADGSESPVHSAKSKRRINPTRLDVSSDKMSPGKEVFGVISRPAATNPKFADAPSADKDPEESSFEVERRLLKLERQRQPKSDLIPETTNNADRQAPIASKVEETIVPRTDLVENIEALDILANIYNGILDRNLMANPMTELYFLVILLTAQYKNSNTKKNSESSYLGSAHNLIYFATMVMLKQQFLLRTLDRVTLKLLCENSQINCFQPELPKYLIEIYKIKCAQAKNAIPRIPRNLHMNVCFQEDTDNRESFPNRTGFISFRKQRDSFYVILKMWEENHLKPDWSFEKTLKNKINALLTLQTDVANYCHLVKLFVSQLLVSSVQSGQTEDPMDDESLSFLKSLKHVNPEKLIQLQGRLVTPLTSTGPVPKPVFPGVQEFYKEFILNARDWKFCVILENTFVHEILDRNDSQFAESDIDGKGSDVDENAKQNFITCVSSLRLLAKFLSYTISMPFKADFKSPAWLASQMELRSRVQPSIDLIGCLKDALFHRRLSLTVPWIVQYMSMLDSTTLRLPYYVNVGSELYRIYRQSAQVEGQNSGNSMSLETAALMMFTIGWLFDLPDFPQDLYFYWQTNYCDRKLRAISHSEESDIKIAKPSEKSIKRLYSLDKLDIIDDRVIYECCPFLAEFKVLLISGNAVLGNVNRHITPVSSQLSQPTSNSKKNVQMELEEAFFHGQPSSVRKTVEFVSERVASSCVKYICNSILSSVTEKNPKTVVETNGVDLVFDVSRENNSDDDNQEKSEPGVMALRQCGMRVLATDEKEAVKKECKEKTVKMCQERTKQCIEALLADDTSPCTKETSAAIANRMARQRVEEWIEKYITETRLKKISTDVKKVQKGVELDQATKKSNYNPEIPWPTEVIKAMRDSMWELLEGKGRWSELSVESLRKTLSCLSEVLTEGEDLTMVPKKKLYVLSVELCLLLLTNRQDLFTTEIQQQFMSIWKMSDTDSKNLFGRIICPRNIQLLTDKSDKSLKIFGRLLKGLLKENLLTIENLSDQCVALFRQEWPETILRQLSQCLNEVVADYKSSSIHGESLKNLLVWIAATCDDMDMCDYD